VATRDAGLCRTSSFILFSAAKLQRRLTQARRQSTRTGRGTDSGASSTLWRLGSINRASHRKQQVSEFLRRCRRLLLCNTRSVLTTRNAIAAPRNQRRRPRVGDMPPFERRQFASIRIKPCRLLYWVAIAALLDMGSPTTTKAAHPAPVTRWSIKQECVPRIRVGRVFKHSTNATDIGERGSETSTVITALMTPARLDQTSKTTPPRTRRVRHHWPRAVVEAGVAGDIPAVDVRKSAVCAAGFNEECRRLHSSAQTFGFGQSLTHASTLAGIERRINRRCTSSRPPVSSVVRWSLPGPSAANSPSER
jgi:hypothetical protein